MAIAAANIAPCERVITLAAPWNFANILKARSRALQDMWRHSEAAAQSSSARCPWRCCRPPSGRSIRQRTVTKFAEFGRLDPGERRRPPLRRARGMGEEGEALPYPAAQGADRGAVRERPGGLVEQSIVVAASVAVKDEQDDSKTCPSLLPSATATRNLAPAATHTHTHTHKHTRTRSDEEIYREPPPPPPSENGHHRLHQLRHTQAREL